MNSRIPSLGHFISYDLWQQAIRLLDFQVSCQDSNRHFKTPSMIYYKSLGSTVNVLQDESYYATKISNNMFYGLEREFSIIPYMVPKPSLGLRRYKFFTYPLRVLYNSVGLYLLRLSEEFINNYYRTRDRLNSFYGGSLYFSGPSLQLSKRNVYFKDHYSTFRRIVRRETEGDVSKRIVIRLDIQNYYEEISVPIMLELLDTNLKSSQKGRMKFDDIAKEQISFFFHYLSNGRLGIPQSDNSLISSFIGHLYMVFGDLMIEDEIRKYSKLLSEYRVIRYVDDTFISISFKRGSSRQNELDSAEALASQIADGLHSVLGLRLNPKTRFFHLGEAGQLQDLHSSLKRVSPEYYLAENLDDEKLENKIESIFHQLRLLKESTLEPETFKHELEGEILKEVFDPRVDELLEEAGNRKRIRSVFSGFDFNRVREYSLPIILIILKDPQTAKEFRQFLLRKSEITTWDADLILTFSCQIDFKDRELVEKLKLYEPVVGIVELIENPGLQQESPGYHKLSRDQCLAVASMPYAIEQIRHRIYSERTKAYSVALNHLVNEIHAICYALDGSIHPKEYDANGVVEFLSDSGVPSANCVRVRNLFDRRNINQVSHPGSDDYVVWSVSFDEYVGYKHEVGECLKVVL